MHTLVLPPRYTDDSISMSRAAARLHWRVERLNSWNVPEELRGTAPAIYGEPLFISVVADPLGTDVLEPTPNWLPELSDEYRKRWVRLTTLGHARRIDAPTFVKPVADKCFTARVYTSGAELPPSNVLPNSELVLLSEPVLWQVEFRAFVLDRNVMTLSPYLRNGELARQPDGTWEIATSEMAEAEDFCKTILADARTQVPPAFVLDVGVISDRGWAVVEANAAWGSGLYACDSEAALAVVRRACIAKAHAAAEDVKWIRHSVP
jgi:ATP-grasp domain-containing protein